MPNTQDPYLVLGIPPTATQAEIAHAFRAAMRANHPDTRGDATSGVADTRLQQLLAAYSALRRPSRTTAATDSGDVENLPRRSPTQRIDRPRTPPLWVGPVRWHRA